MQKEKLAPSTETQEEKETSRATPEILENISGGSVNPQPKYEESGESPSPAENLCPEESQARFEELIKGPYKEAFTAKVQGIINKRFKEEKSKEAKRSAAPSESEIRVEAPNSIPSGTTEPIPEEENATFAALLEAGIDAEIAYRVLHFDEMMDASMRYGAQTAAKQLADSIRRKGKRPTENGTQTSGGLTPHRGAAGLTPQKRRELAQKALMGKPIGF